MVRGHVRDVLVHLELRGREMRPEGRWGLAETVALAGFKMCYSMVGFLLG